MCVGPQHELRIIIYSVNISKATPLLAGKESLVDQEDAPAGGAPASDAPVGQVDGAPPSGAPAGGAPVGQVDGAPAGGAPVGQVDGAPPGGAPVGQVDGAPPSGAPVGQVDGAPPGGAPVGGAPPGGAPVGGAPPGGAPVGDATSFEKWFGGFLHFCFYSMSFLSGQLMLDFIRPQNAKLKLFKVIIFIIELFFIFIFVCLNAGVLVFNFWTIFACRFPNCGYIAGPLELYPYNIHNNLSKDPSPDLNQEYFDLHKLEFTMATLSGSLSYFIMMYILITHYSVVSTGYRNKKSRIREWFGSLDSQYRAPENEDNHTILNPFLHETEDDGDDYQKVVLYAKQICCFYLIFFLNIALFAANVTIFFVIAHAQNTDKDAPENKKYRGHEYIDYAGLAALFSSQYCAIISCFIFSKVAYAVTIECDKQLQKYITCVQEQEADEVKIVNLQRIDRSFVKLSKRSMKPYRFWFAVHWFLYAVTAFISVAYLAETIIELLYGYLHHDCPNDPIHMCYLRIVFESLFTLQHMILFLYPCFRAASILEARNSLIKKVSNETNINISTEFKSIFLQYMKDQKCGFMLSIFCARIEFGFNIAYLSIFLGLLGIVIKLSL